MVIFTAAWIYKTIITRALALMQHFMLETLLSFSREPDPASSLVNWAVVIVERK
ncbi:hypothetical protein A359_06770 [secondary endosymbiont of Ctenarytaina eucalypti]|uniref:Uncharacterized protein n=1 Tax=secondary endosymbiont of Ctenarytaina eucalypti TaxID=1199245 RepID=J3TFM2_9ENTR|nr:hypothetical protein A359_06770 [secondary endosymbiont of Ctenarytaina eucalypti]